MDLTQKAPQPRPLWTTEDVAGYLAVPVKTLYKWRLEKHGPPCLRVGKHLGTYRRTSWPGSKPQAARS